MEVAKQIGFSVAAARAAYRFACEKQHQFLRAMKNEGERLLHELAQAPDEFAVVLFGHPYNAFVDEINMGIPHKFASRGIRIIPFDFLPFEDEDCDQSMYWGTGQMILKAARLVEKHPQLYGAFITNFSCGPDSFIISYFRDIMGTQPSLTLELDEHTADAGLDTRIDAFLDIIRRHRQLKTGVPAISKDGFRPAEIRYYKKDVLVTTSSGKQIPLKDPRVHLLIPSMGGLGTEAMAAVFRKLNIRATALEMSDKEALKLGRGNTSCKE